MKELLIILLVIAVLMALAALRYRRQLLAAYQIWSAFRSFQKKNITAEVREPSMDAGGPLVNCARCKAWVVESVAIRLGTRTFYCSAACMEKAATAA